MLENGNAHQESVADSVKYTVMMNKTQFGSLWKKTRRMRATPTAWNWTLSERARVRAKEKRQQSKLPRPGNMDANTCNNCGTSGHWAKDWRKPGGDANYSSNSGFHKGKGKGKVKGERAKGKQGTLCRRTAILARVFLRKRHRCLFLHRLQVLQFW